MIVDKRNYEVANTISFDLLLSELPFNLIKESIKEQVNNPMLTNTDYATVILDKCRVLKSEYADDEEAMIELNETLQDFFEFIIETINKKFRLDIDVDSLNDSIKGKVAMNLYSFLILKYSMNVRYMLSNFISKNKKVIASNYMGEKKKDVDTLSLKKIVKSREDVVILANLTSVIKYIISFDHDINDFMNMLVEPDIYDGEYVKSLVQDFTIPANFSDAYLEPLLDDNDDVMNEIIVDLRLMIMKLN